MSDEATPIGQDEVEKLLAQAREGRPAAESRRRPPQPRDAGRGARSIGNRSPVCSRPAAAAAAPPKPKSAAAAPPPRCRRPAQQSPASARLGRRTAGAACRPA